MSDARESPPEPGSEAERLFAQYLESLDTDEEQDFDDLCAAYPAQDTDLRALRAAWRADEPGAVPPGPEISFFRRGRETVASPLPGVEPGRLIGDFRILSYIGGGGMGQVWEAEELALRRRVALKLVLPGRVDPHGLELFAREARAGGRLSHPGIVRVHGFGETDGVHWINQELVEGGWTLRDFIDEMRNAESLPEDYYRRVAQFAVQLADALQAAHDASVIHRDVKPQNVLITPQDGPKLTDFGLARITDESVHSVTGEFAGTYLYMSPEQVTARRMGIDHRTDVFSLGVVLYEMLALQRPFEGDTTHQIAEKIVTWDPPDLHKLRSRIPVELAVICGKALEKRRDDRYQTMAELAADIRRHLANEPILAKPPGPIRRAQKWMLRNPTRSVAGVAFVAIVVISWLGLRIAEQKDDLEAMTTALRRSGYHAALSASSSAIEVGAIAEARSFLDDCPPEHSLWEWEYLNALADPNLMALFGHQGSVDSLDFSPGGKRIVSGSADGTVRIWEPETGKLLATLEGHEGVVNSVEFSPDGGHILSASRDMTVRVWNSTTFRAIQVLEHDDVVLGATFDPEGRQIASLSSSGVLWQVSEGTRTMTGGVTEALTIWDTETWEPVSVHACTLPEGAGDGAPNSLAYLRDGRHAVVGYTSGQLAVIDTGAREGAADEGRAGMRVLGSPSGIFERSVEILGRPVEVLGMSVSASPFLDCAVVAGKGTDLWDLNTEKRALRLSPKDTTCVVFSADGCCLAMGNKDGTATIRSLFNKTSAQLRGHDCPVTAVAFSPDGRYLASGAEDGTIRLWQAANLPVQEIELDSSLVGYEPSGMRAMTTRWGGGLDLWDSTTWSRIASLEHERIQTAAWSADGRCVITGAASGEVEVWDSRDLAKLASFSGGERVVGSVAMSSNDVLVASVEGGELDFRAPPESGVSTIRVWEVATGDLIHTLSCPGTYALELRFHREGAYLACASDGGARIWEMPSGQEVRALSRGPVWGFDRDNGLLSIEVERGLSRVANALTDDVQLELAGEVRSLVLSADGRRAFGETEDGIRVFDTESGRGLTSADLRHHQGVAVRFDGNQITTDGWDGALVILTGPLESARLVHATRFNRRALVKQLLDSLGSPREVLVGLRREGELDLETTILLKELITARGVDTLELAQEARRIVLAPDRSPEDDEIAYYLARLQRIDPDIRGPEIEEFLVGAALHRQGRHRLARSWFTTSGDDPCSLAFNAMNLLALEGVTSRDAWRRFDEFLRSMETPEHKDDPELRTLGEEVEQVFARTRELRKEARSLYKQLSAEGGTTQEIIERLESMDEPDQPVRELAVEVARYEATSLNRASWAVVMSSGRKPEEYARALEQARRVVRLVPTKNAYQNTLGVALYRNKVYPEAIEILERCNATNEQSKRPDDRACDLFFLAMSHHQLGAADEANRLYREACELMNQEDVELQQFRAEAQDLLGVR